MATQPRFVKNNPQVPERLQKVQAQNRVYLAHEYFNQDWLPMPFSSMAQWLTPAKVAYACSAFYTDHIAPLNLTPDQAAFLDTVTDPLSRETVRDFMVDQQFRKDYRVKGARKLSLTEAIMVLAGAGCVASAQDEDTAARAKPHTDRLNSHLLETARHNDNVPYLASPVTGGAITVQRFGQLFLLAARQGLQQPPEWAQFVWQLLQAQNQKLVHDGQTPDSAEANLAELTTQAHTFATTRLPVLRALQVV